MSAPDASDRPADPPDRAPAVPAAEVAAHVARVVAFFETIGPRSVERIVDVYSADAFFKDPFNEVRGVPAVQRIFVHMFEQVESPRFVVTETLVQGGSALLVWDFEFEFKRPLPSGPRRIRGCSLLRFDGMGRIAYHRDYWDAAEELYEKLPIVGGLMRLLRRRGAAGPR
jgi:steroid delta-isomerase